MSLFGSDDGGTCGTHHYGDWSVVIPIQYRIAYPADIAGGTYPYIRKYRVCQHEGCDADQWEWKRLESVCVCGKESGEVHDSSLDAAASIVAHLSDRYGEEVLG